MANLSAKVIKDILRDKIPDGLVVAEHNEFGHFYRERTTNQLFGSVTAKCGILEKPALKRWAANLAAEHVIASIIKNPSMSVADLEKVKTEAVLAHNDLFNDAGDTGNRGHKIIEEYLQVWMDSGVRPSDIRSFVHDEDARVFAIARSAELFCKEYNVIPIASELLVASLKYKFAGTLDSLMMILNVNRKGENGCVHDFLQGSKRNVNKVVCMYCGLAGEYEFALVDWKSSNSIDKVEYAMQVSAYRQALFEMTGLQPKRMYIVRLDKNQAKYEVRAIMHYRAAFRAFVHAAKIYDWLNDGTEKLVSANLRERILLEDLQLNPL